MAKSSNGKTRETGRYHHGDLKAALRAAAESILIERGVAEVGLREVARAVGVSHAAPYRHYDSREALLADIAAGGFERLGARMARIGEAPPRERIAALAGAYVGFALEEPAIFRLMFGPELSKPSHPDLKAKADAAFGAAREAVVALGVEAPATMESLTCWGLVHGLATLMLDDRIEEHGGEFDAEGLMREAGDILLAGLSARISTKDARGG